MRKYIQGATETGQAPLPTGSRKLSYPATKGMAIFFEVFEGLPRQGPGTRDAAARALALCRDLPPNPAILDIGCGTGGQTLYLAALTSGSIVAMDSHAPSIRRLSETVAAQGLEDRIRPLVADMAAHGLPPASFDLVWSEGALYNLGIKAALAICHELLRPGGYLVFSEPVRIKENPPEPVRAMFESEYPAMGSVEEALRVIARGSFAVLGHFTLPDAAWWDEFYTPMLAWVRELRNKYASDPEALAALDEVAREPEFHRMHSEYYAYEFFALRRAS